MGGERKRRGIHEVPDFFFKKEECDYLIEYAKDRLERSTVVSQTGQTGPQVGPGSWELTPTFVWVGFLNYFSQGRLWEV